MLVTATEEVEVKASADEVWNFYNSFLLTQQILELFPDFAEKYEVQGDGGVGTVLNFTLQPKSVGYYKEKFTVVDNEKRIKVIEEIEGGHLGQGFDRYRIRYEIIEKQKWICITRGTVECETQDLAVAKYALDGVQVIVTVMKAVADHITKTLK